MYDAVVSHSSHCIASFSVKLFVDQSDSDGVLDDVATMIGCTRSNLHVVASDKGLVVGRINFYEDGDFIDCTKMGVGGKVCNRTLP